MKKWILLGSAIILSSCAGLSTVPKLPIPDRPTLPAIPANEMQCLSDQAYRDLVIGRKLLLNHIDTLENILLTTH